MTSLCRSTQGWPPRICESNSQDFTGQPPRRNIEGYMKVINLQLRFLAVTEPAGDRHVLVGFALTRQRIRSCVGSSSRFSAETARNRSGWKREGGPKQEWTLCLVTPLRFQWVLSGSSCRNRKSWRDLAIVSSSLERLRSPNIHQILFVSACMVSQRRGAGCECTTQVCFGLGLVCLTV